MARPVDNSPAGVLARTTKRIGALSKRVRAFQTLKQKPGEEDIKALENSANVLLRIADGYRNGFKGVVRES